MECCLNTHVEILGSSQFQATKKTLKKSTNFGGNAAWTPTVEKDPSPISGCKGNTRVKGVRTEPDGQVISPRVDTCLTNNHLHRETDRSQPGPAWNVPGKHFHLGGQDRQRQRKYLNGVHVFWASYKKPLRSLPWGRRASAAPAMIFGNTSAVNSWIVTINGFHWNQSSRLLIPQLPVKLCGKAPMTHATM